MSDQVRIVEVGPRDGLQNEKTPVSAEARIALVKALLAAGLPTIEVGAFVSPRAIPQMVNSDQVLRGLGGLNGEFHVLVPNEKGYDAARAAGAKIVSVFAAASEGFSRANINCTVAESIERFKPVLARAKADGVKVRGYISCVLGCPFDGEIKPKAVADLATTLWELGCYEISLGDTIGVGTPEKAKEMLRHAQDEGWLTWHGFVSNDRAMTLIDGSLAGLSLLQDLPNYRHSMPTKILEYMAHGVPVITTPLPAAVSLLATGRESPKPCADIRFAGTPLLTR
jgi:isopropylmalate/homocitrate/citramalate synthase